MKRYLIACAIILSLCSFGYAEKRAKVTGYVFQEDTTGAKAPVAGLLVKLNRPGEAKTTTSKGYFEIQTSVDGYIGEKIVFHIEKKGWVIKIPANGAYNIPKFSDIIKVEIVLVREGDKSLLNHAQIMAFLYDEVARLSKAKAEDRDTEFLKLLTEYSKRLKIKEKDLQQAIAGWIKNVKTSEEKALAAFHRRDFDETVSEANKILRESVNIRMLKANALLAKLDYETAVEEYKIVIHDAPTHADAINFIGRILHDLAKYEEALSHYDRYLPVLKIRYREISPEVATGINNLALALASKGDYAGALEKYNEALKIDEAYFGWNHPNVAIRLNNIAAVLESKGDYAGALEKCNEALKIDEAYFGRNHPNVARELNNIALVLNEQGDYAGALEKYNEALKIFKGAFGRLHPNVATGLNNIAVVLYAKGDYAGALEKYNEALKIYEAYFGRNHPNVATGLNDIAGVLESKGDYAGALEKYNEALKIDEACFGRNHPNVARELNNIAGVLAEQGDYAGALEKYNEALKIDEAYFGRNHPSVAIRLNNIGEVLRAKGDYAGALEKYNEALQIDEACLGRNHPNVAIILNNIGEVLESKGDYTGALEKYNEALKIFEKFLGADHPNTRTVRENRNRAYLASLPAQQQWQLRTQRLLALWQAPPQALSASDSLNLLNGLGVGYTKQSKADSALLFLRQALPIAERLNEQEMLGTLYNNLGSANKLKQDWPQARQWLEKSLGYNRALAGDSAAVLAYTYFHLAGVAQAEGRTALSREYAQKSLALAERHKLSDLRKEMEALLKQKR